MSRNKVVPTGSSAPEPIIYMYLPTAARCLGSTVRSFRKVLRAKKITILTIGRNEFVSVTALAAYVARFKAGVI